MMMHSTVDNQPWADRGEGKEGEGEEGRQVSDLEGSLETFF